MSERIPNQPNKKGNLTRRGKAVVAGGLLLTGALTGKVVDDKIDDFRANAAQPACEIVAEAGDTIYSMQSELAQAGDSVKGEKVKVFVPGEDYRERNPQQDRDFYVGGSMALKIGDVVQIENVDAGVCETVGGQPALPEVQKPEN